MVLLTAGFDGLEKVAFLNKILHKMSIHHQYGSSKVLEEVCADPPRGRPGTRWNTVTGCPWWRTHSQSDTSLDITIVLTPLTTDSACVTRNSRLMYSTGSTP